MEAFVRIAITKYSRDSSVRYIYHALERFITEGGGNNLLETAEDT